MRVALSETCSDYLTELLELVCLSNTRMPANKTAMKVAAKIAAKATIFNA